MARRTLPWDYAVRNLGRSPLRLTLTVVGSFLVVLLAMAAVGFAQGMREGMSAERATGNVIVLGAGSEESVERSEISSSVPGILAASVPGVRERLGLPYVSPEIVFATEVTIDGLDGGRIFGTFRGVREAAYLVHPEVRVLSGRVPGPDEIMVGRLAAARMGVDEAALREGSVVRLDGRPFTIVGDFEAPGTVLEAELWADLEDLRVTTQRDNLSCVVATMETPDGFEDVDVFAKQRLDLELVAMRESEYYDQAFAFYRPVRWMVGLSAGLIALGALLGGLNTMYAAFAARIREFATLQAVGFSRPAIVWSLIQESSLGAAAGSLLATVVALATLDGVAVKISMGAFGIAIDEVAVAYGLGAGLLVGIGGALPPAIRCLRMPVAQALRAG